MLLHRRPITQHGVRSTSLKIGQMKALHDSTTSKKASAAKLKLQIFKALKRLSHVAIPAAMPIMMAFRDTDTETQPAKSPSQQETLRKRHRGPIVAKPKFNWDAHGNYVYLVNVNLEVTNLLETGACKISDEEKPQLIRTG